MNYFANSSAIRRWAIYGPQSNLVHASNAIIHTKRTEDDTLGSAFLSSPEEGLKVLMVGCILFCLVMSEMQNHIGFGPTAEAQIERFRQEWLKVFRTEPAGVRHNERRHSVGRVRVDSG
jgi:hypothetical protein